jgi:PII-like signaling protein
MRALEKEACNPPCEEIMGQLEPAFRLRIFLGEDDKYHGRPLYEEIVVRAQQSRLAGATVFRGNLGYGAAGLDAAKLLRRSNNVPIVVEILDTERKVNAFLEYLGGLLTSGVATVEQVQMRRYSPKRASSAQ